MLQAHHLGASKIQSYGNILHGDWRYYRIPACGQSENKCGVCIILSDKWMQFIFHSQQVVEGRAHYLLLKISDLVYGFLNIYVPNDRAACKGFWTHFVQQLPHVDHWCMGGDFIMIEAAGDRVGVSNVVLACCELASWVCFLLRIQDAWHLP